MPKPSPHDVMTSYSKVLGPRSCCKDRQLTRFSVAQSGFGRPPARKYAERILRVNWHAGHKPGSQTMEMTVPRVFVVRGGSDHFREFP